MIHTFPNGLRFACKKSNSPVAYCALSIKAGTRDEAAEYNGLAHLTEHMLFKGTASRSSKVINSYIERLGGELNAYTTKEETVLHVTLLKEDISKAIDLLFEIAYTSLFPEKELIKEKIVILDEINSYKDSPSELIFDDFEEMLFRGHALSMPVLGKKESLKKIKAGTVREYVINMFVPQNMSFTVVSGVDERRVLRMVEKSMLKYTGGNIRMEKEKDVYIRPSLSYGEVFRKEIVKKSHQAHCIIGASAYSLYDEDLRIPLILLVNILGGPATNSRLNLTLREKNGLVYSVDASYNQYSDTGVVSIYFGCDKVNLQKCLKLVDDELDRLMKGELSQTYLDAAKKQLLGQMTISSDNGESQCLSMGKSLLVYGNIMTPEEIRIKIETITAADVLKVARQVFAKERLSVLIYR